MTSLQASSPPPDDPRDDSLDRRWDAWMEKGRARETRTRMSLRAAIAAVVIIVVAGAVWAWLASRG